MDTTLPMGCNWRGNPNYRGLAEDEMILASLTSGGMRWSLSMIISTVRKVGNVGPSYAGSR